MDRQTRNATPKTRPRRFAETGQGLGEYALILALVAVLAIGATSFLGGQINGTLSTVGDRIQGSVSGQTGGPGPDPTVEPTAPSTPQPTPQPTVRPTPTPPTAYNTKKKCLAAGYAWITKPKPAHCA